MSQEKKGPKKLDAIPVNYVKATEAAKKIGRAKKAFVISQSGYVRNISVGDDLTDVPAKYHQNLKTEGVID